MQGYWSACYGPHGLEIVHVAMCGPQEPGEPQCPHGTSHRLVATKVPPDSPNPLPKTASF